MTTISHGETNTIEQPIINSYTGTWTRENNTINISVGDKHTSETIAKLTETRLEYVSKATETITKSGIKTIVEVTITTVFTKQ
ncbi:hypothetical protein [Marixanthomonas spongiae]|uniref:Lipocalin-like domain-containing protein n=1 Tax=Marixanthomonas spongiae TaxID=2174845 RepID=A0A2U0I7R0_9FLAO|nr:hypothetical protein [Marixanthomonas spongiae]PVW17143.1 hypothetical protein DDV96_01080 [Marixanthomonas spongiae]